MVAVVFDDKDNIAALQRREADLVKYRGMDVYFTSGAALAPGAYKCRIVIRDLETGAAAVASAATVVAKPATVGLSLHSPLLLVSGSNFAYLEAAPSRTRDKLAWTDAYVYDRAKYSPFVGTVPAGSSKIYAALPCSVTGLVAPEVALSAFLIRSETGEAIPLPLTGLSRASNVNTEIRLVEISLAGLRAGAYRLYLHGEDAASHSVSYAQTALVITAEGPIRK